MEIIETRVLCIGSGFSGLAVGIGLLKQGIRDFIIIEKARQIGGTWRDNTYPGCACDTPSHVYSFSFARNPNWSRAFAEQPEIQAYLLDVAERFSIIPHIHFETEAIKSTWDNGLQRWVVETNRRRYHARFLVLGQGPLHEAQIPKIPGLDSFAGTTFHSSRWRHDYDLRGKRVAVIGTGASAIQFVPKVQPLVEKLFVFQRKAPWVMPKLDRTITPLEKWALKHVPGLLGAVSTALYLSAEPLQLAQRRPALVRQVQRIAHWHLRRQVPDATLRRALTPKFTLGCKRILLSNTWYPAIQAPNVELVAQAATRVTPEGIIGEDGIERRVDTLIFGTGFFVTNAAKWKTMIGRQGETLDEAWKGSPQAYLGTTCRGFPNAFLMFGPNTANGHGSALVAIEAQARYIVDVVATAEREGIDTIEVREDAHQVWNEKVQAALAPTVFNTGCESFYIDANGRNSSIYPWTTLDLSRRLRRFDQAPYEIQRRARGASPDAPQASASARKI
jgi:cation diffusion facilitator CzcD-associated flavoprotein CzcO